ncbi:MAG: aldo/keto reductase, partial [Propionicimonas sp.]|nr:aldo/keto reductase [Propionicimonas sp.]
MQYTRLGRSGATVSSICLGTMNFGPLASEPDAFEVMDSAFELGVNFFDTADVYGGPPLGDQPGQTEEILGRWMLSRRSRDDLVLSTKVHGAMGPGPNDRGLSSLHIRRAVEGSLRRLQTDHIDVYHMHHIDPDVPADEVLDALTRLRDQGKISYIGSSNFPGWRLAQYADLAAATGRAGIVVEQSVYNLAQRMIELEVIPAAQHYGIGLLPWSPLAGGKLAGILRKPDPHRSRTQSLGSQLKQVSAYERRAPDLGLTPDAVGIAWLLHQPVVTAAVIGPRSADHVRSAVTATEVSFG